MDSEVYAFALKNTLDEIQKACPDIKNAFVLGQNCTIIAHDDNTTEETLTRAVEILNEMLQNTDKIGGVDDLTIQGINGRVNVSRMEEVYLVTVTSRKADLKYINTVTRVLFPTVLKLLDKLESGPIRVNPPEIQDSEMRLEVEHEKIAPEQSAEPAEPKQPEEEAKTAEKEEEKHEESTEKIAVEPYANQFIVEDMKGLLSPSDTVRIDSMVIEKWNELYENRKIEAADVETFGGKTVRSKVKPIKDGKLEGQGKVQIPGKMQLVLDIKKGELVRVKPVVE
jgi:predicted regulator of Ras-like GTPase activity (Roadblock/LC7/MglB family)